MRVSIIIPAYNSQDYIERSLISAFAAGKMVPGSFEIICVDNNSSDDTNHIIRRWEKDHPTAVRYVHCEKPGACAARNLGAAYATGDWLQFLDADDTIAADKIANQLTISEESLWIVGAYRHIYSPHKHEDAYPNPDLWKGLFFGFGTGHTISNLIHRSAFDLVGGWNEDLFSNQDPELCFRLLCAGVPVVIDPEVASFYHHHDGPRITNTDPGQGVFNRLTMLAAARSFLIQSNPAYYRQNANYFLGAILRSIRILATYDLDRATQTYESIFGDDDEWADPSSFEHVPLFTRLYPYLGFRNVEASRRVLARVLPAGLKARLKG